MELKSGNNIRFQLADELRTLQTMASLTRAMVVQFFQSIKVLGKKELQFGFTYQNDYEEALNALEPLLHEQEVA